MLIYLFDSGCWSVCTNCDEELFLTFSLTMYFYSRRVWPVNRGCLLLHGTWSHILFLEVRVVQCSLSLYMFSGRFWRFWLWYIWFLYYITQIYRHAMTCSLYGHFMCRDTLRTSNDTLSEIGQHISYISVYYIIVYKFYVSLTKMLS